MGAGDLLLDRTSKACSDSMTAFGVQIPTVLGYLLWSNYVAALEQLQPFEVQ
jgi:hypothetical protein